MLFLLEYLPLFSLYVGNIFRFPCLCLQGSRKKLKKFKLELWRKGKIGRCCQRMERTEGKYSYKNNMKFKGDNFFLVHSPCKHLQFKNTVSTIWEHSVATCTVHRWSGLPTSILEVILVDSK